MTVKIAPNTVWKHGIIGRVERARRDALQDLEREIPDREDDEDGDQHREYENDDLLELLVKAQQIEPPARVGEFLLQTHGLVLLAW